LEKTTFPSSLRLWSARMGCGAHIPKGLIPFPAGSRTDAAATGSEKAYHGAYTRNHSARNNCD